MNKQQIAKLFDPQAIAAVEFLATEDANMVLAIWFRMLTLAAHDPEGCVRLTPGLHMETAELAEYFHCPAEAVETAAQVLEQLQQLTREEDDTLKLIACAGLCRRGKNKKSVVTDFSTTEKENEKEKRKEPKEKSKEINKKADIADAISKGTCAPGRRPEESESETQSQDTAATTQATDNNTQNTRQPPKKKNRLTPAAELPEPIQHILNAWNQLPLGNKFEGLYPGTLAKMQALLEQYGEEALLKAIANVANSSFLLGHSRNNRGWSISLGWLLNPEHLENILQGKYRDKQPRSQSLLFQPGDEETPYSNGFYGKVVD